MKICVTGASGYVASHLINQYVLLGHKVVALTRGPDSSLCDFFELDNVSLISVDYDDVPRLVSCLSGCDVIVHAASKVHSSAPPLAQKSLYFDSIFRLTKNLVDASILAAVPRFVYISTIGVSTLLDRPVLDEYSSICPSSYYAYYKYISECYLIDRSSCFDDYIILRPPLVYGPGCPGNFFRLESLLRFLPFLLFFRISTPKNFISIDNLTYALVCTSLSSLSARGLYVVCDPDPVSVSFLFSSFFSRSSLRSFFGFIPVDFLVNSFIIFFPPSSVFFKVFGPAPVSCRKFLGLFPRFYVNRSFVNPKFFSRK